ncbi:MAG: trigger factor [Clostridia bacterium]|nr:trigger factor [Clostridia bacterium]
MLKNKEDLGKNTLKLTIEVEAEEFARAMDKAYNKIKKNIKVNGFRPGTAPKDVVIKMYGEEMLYNDALDFILGPTYEEAIKSENLEPVGYPKVDVVEIGTGKNLVYTAEVALKPEVTLGKYKGVKVEKESAEVTDEDVENAIKMDAEKNARIIEVEDRNTKMGDTVNIDFAGSIDGVEFEGGSAKGFELVLGSKSFIDNFEDQLCDKKIGEEVDVNVTFPKDYGKEDLNGKKALFKCKINSITEKVMPEINDEFAQDVSEFDTLAEYKEDLKKSLAKQKEEAVKNAMKAKVLEAVASDVKVEIPEVMIDNQVDQMVNRFAQQLSMQGMKFDDFMKYTGMGIDQIREQYKADAERDIKIALTLEAVAKEEKIEASEEEVNKELQGLADRMKKSVDEIKSMMGARLTEMKEELTMEKTIDFLVENSKN